MIRYCIDDGCKRKIESSKMADKKKQNDCICRCGGLYCPKERL